MLNSTIPEELEFWVAMAIAGTIGTSIAFLILGIGWLAESWFGPVVASRVVEVLFVLTICSCFCLQWIAAGWRMEKRNKVFEKIEESTRDEE